MELGQISVYKVVHPHAQKMPVFCLRSLNVRFAPKDVQKADGSPLVLQLRFMFEKVSFPA
jgi:hypothetical protein